MLALNAGSIAPAESTSALRLTSAAGAARETVTVYVRVVTPSTAVRTTEMVVSAPLARSMLALAVPFVPVTPLTLNVEVLSWSVAVTVVEATESATESV